MIFCLNHSPTSVDNLRNFPGRGSLLSVFEICEHRIPLSRIIYHLWKISQSQVQEINGSMEHKLYTGNIHLDKTFILDTYT